MNTSNQYPNPPIVEVVCQLAFDEAADWSPASPGQLFGGLEADYPLRPETRTDLVARVGQAQGQAHVSLAEAANRIVFRDSGGTRLVIAGDSSLAVSGLAPWEGFDSLRERFRHAVDVYEGIVGLPQVKAVSLRYINRIEIPRGSNTDDYFTIPIHTAEGGYVVESMQRSVCFYPSVEAQIATTFGLMPTAAEDSETLGVVLDIDVVKQASGVIGSDDATMVVSDLHGIENREFEASITPKSRELFR